jgi:hypothetical protein
VVQAVERAQERILADVLSLLGADDPRRHPHDHGPVAIDELLESAQLTARQAERSGGSGRRKPAASKSAVGG